MKYLLFVILLLLTTHSYAQKPIDNTNALKVKITERLSSKGIDSVLFFIRISPSPTIVHYIDSDIEESYVSFDGFVFWKENSKMYIQKFDYHREFQPQEIKNFDVINYAFQNLKKIKSEVILPYQTLEKGKKETFITPNQYNECFSFNIGNVQFEKIFFAYGLRENDSFDPKMKNINFSENNRLKIAQLYKMCLAESNNFKEE